jgi:hypothetical protein
MWPEAVRGAWEGPFCCFHGSPGSSTVSNMAGGLVLASIAFQLVAGWKGALAGCCDGRWRVHASTGSGGHNLLLMGSTAQLCRAGRRHVSSCCTEGGAKQRDCNAVPGVGGPQNPLVVLCYRLPLHKAGRGRSCRCGCLCSWKPVRRHRAGSAVCAGLGSCRRMLWSPRCFRRRGCYQGSHHRHATPCAIAWAPSAGSTINGGRPIVCEQPVVWLQQLTAAWCACQPCLLLSSGAVVQAGACFLEVWLCLL